MANRFVNRDKGHGICGRLKLQGIAMGESVPMADKKEVTEKEEDSDLQFLDQFLQVTLGSLFVHDLEHLLADSADLTRLSVASRSSSLVLLLLGESNSKQTQDVSIRSADIDGTFDQGLPLADQGAQLVTSHVHAVEVGEDVSSLNILSNQSDLAEGLAFITTVEFSEGNLEYTALQAFRGDLGTSGLGDDGLAGIADSEDGRSLDVVQLLTGERIRSLLLATLLALGEALILSCDRE
jgi:hypothetical protein